MTKEMKIIDISREIKNSTPVYPGNPRVKITRHKGATSVHSEILLGSHTATHIDAPVHALKGGAGMDKLALEKFIGPCRVLDVSDAKDSVKIEDLKKYKIKKGERVLVKTSNSKRQFKKFYNDYVYLDGDAADYLARIGIILFGIDYLSVKKRGGKDNRPHTSLLKKSIPILEGLDLSKVQEGRYEFVGLPLKLGFIDGSPCRAVLIKK